MRHAVILAGGSGTRLWPMSRTGTPKQLLPLFGGKSLLALAFERLEGFITADRRWVCASESHRRAILRAVPGLAPGRFLGEPVARDTLAATTYASAVIARGDPEAVICVLTADHLIEPRESLQEALRRGFEAAESGSGILVTFGVAPTHPATAYGYLRLGPRPGGDALVVEEFKEKPDAATAAAWVAEGPGRFLWNSGMFVWRAPTFLDCVRRYEPGTFAAIGRIADAWGSRRFGPTALAAYEGLRKISVDFAVMERASRDPSMKVVAVPLSLSWKDIGSWPAYAEILAVDGQGNASAAGKSILVDTKGSLVVSDDPGHLVAVLGCDDLVVVHTPSATLVCRKDRAEELKKLYGLVAERFGEGYV